ncbi:HMA2 domain-containing protein [Ferrimonas futtsuensis]|uniref:HMA2 domain-containing protein n=1 Tax=Ferrimonas futtsuensis TaxID=364764 RepID=UPI00040C4A0F|nr:hypothetical protein [Ferrimonas futtsuensis]
MPNTAKEIVKLRQWVHVAHHIPGRIRLKFNSALVTQMARFKTEQILEQADRLPPLKRFQLNTGSNSLILEYDHGTIHPGLLDRLFGECQMGAEQACQELIDLLAPHYQ